MSTLGIILVMAGVMLGIGLLAVVAWLASTSWLNLVERRLARRKGIYRELVTSLATRERALLEPEIHRRGTLLDLEALEAVLEEQARAIADRPAWLLDAYDRLGLVDKYVERLRTARRWRERAFAAELLGRVGNAKAVPALLGTVQATRTEDGDVREIALRALARIADPRAVAPLIEALKTADVWLAPRIADILTRHGELVVDPLIAVLELPDHHPARPWAANILGEVRAQRAFPVLARALGDPEDEVRAKSATALGRLGDRRAVAYLVEHLLTDPAPFVRARIAGTLGRFHDPEVIDWLVRALGDPAWWVRMRSVEALEQIGAVAEGALLLALGDPDPEIRLRAALALERLGVPAGLVAMIERGDRVPQAMETLVKFATAGARELLADLLLHPSAAVRTAVVTVIRGASRRDLAPELIRLAGGDPDPALRALAFEALRVFTLPEAVPPALEGMGDADERVRAAAIRLLGDLGAPEVVGRLRQRTGDPQAPVRAATVRALGLLRAASAAPDFERLLGDPEPEVREAAASAAGEAGTRSLVSRLLDLLNDGESGVRGAAARALGALGDRAAVPALVHGFAAADPQLGEAIIESVSRLEVTAVAGLVDRLIESQDTPGKLGAIRTLSHHRSPAAESVVQRLWRDPEPAVRAAAMKAFGRLGGAAAAPAVAVGVSDPDGEVRANAVDACGRLGLTKMGPIVLRLLVSDPSPRVRQRAALAVGLLRVPDAEPALHQACHQPEPLEVRTAAVLAAGALGEDSVVARVVEMADESLVREQLREGLKNDPEFRLLGRSLPAARHIELRALGALTPEEVRVSLVGGMRGVLDAGERIRLISGLRALRDGGSTSALLELMRGDPSPEVRTAALTALGGLLGGEELHQVARRALADPSLSVRRAAVGLFARIPSEPGLATVLQALRADEDPAVLAAVAELAEGAFPAFVELARGLQPDGPEAVLVVEVARHIHHPELPRLLRPMARSASPDVREAVARLWRHRPDLSDPAGLGGLTLDPAASVRREAAGAVVRTQRWELLERMLEDPDAAVRREIAVALGRAGRGELRGRAALERLAADPHPEVLAAAYVGRLLQGTPAPFPPGLERRSGADAVVAIANLGALREAARTSPSEDRRLAAALALALLGDDVAQEVARTDPVPAIRHRVSGALELAEAEPAGVPA